MQAKNESKDDVTDPTSEDLSTYAKKFADLRKKVDMKVKANVNEAQKRQKKQASTSIVRSWAGCSREEYEEAIKEG